MQHPDRYFIIFDGTGTVVMMAVGAKKHGPAFFLNIKRAAGNYYRVMLYGIKTDATEIFYPVYVYKLQGTQPTHDQIECLLASLGIYIARTSDCKHALPLPATSEPAVK